MKKKLYRSRNDRVLTGLAGGTAKYFGIDSNLVRAILVILEFATAGFLIIGYLVVAIIVPLEPEDDRKHVKSKVNNP